MSSEALFKAKIMLGDHPLTSARTRTFGGEHSFKMHTHDTIELYYFISGDCRCLVEGTEYLLQPRDILLIRPMESHTMIYRSDTPYERIVFNIPMRLLEQADPSGKLKERMLSRPLGTHNLFTDADLGGEQFGDCLLSINESTEPASIIACCLLLLSEALRASANKSTEPRTDRLGARIIDYVNRELFSPLSLESLSEEFFISRSQINRIFKENTGSSLWQYITAKRLLAARHRIRRGEPAMLVAAECGYSDYSAFYRAYFKRFGISPQNDKK